MRTRLVLTTATLSLAAGTSLASAAPPHWSIAPTPRVDSGGGALNSVVMTRGGGFAVGSQATSAGVDQPLIERYAAGAWQRMTLPTYKQPSQLLSVDGTNKEAWAVGMLGAHALAERWDGHRWKTAVVPPESNSELEGVSVVSPSDAWAVGWRVRKSAPVPWTIHWNGGRWTTVAAPNPGHALNGLAPTAILTSVTTQGTHVYAVGSADARGRGSGHAIAEKLEDGHWSVMLVPTLPGRISTLTSITGTSNKDLWAVGSDYNDSPHTVALHWNGHDWRRTSTPDPGDGELTSVSIGTPNSIWAVGDYTASDGWTKPLAEHWNGSRWTREAVPAAALGSFHGCTGYGDGYQGLKGVSVVPGSAQVWAVGYHDPLTCKGGRLPLTEHYR